MLSQEEWLEIDRAWRQSISLHREIMKRRKEEMEECDKKGCSTAEQNPDLGFCPECEMAERGRIFGLDDLSTKILNMEQIHQLHIQAYKAELKEARDLIRKAAEYLDKGKTISPGSFAHGEFENYLKRVT